MLMHKKCQKWVVLDMSAIYGLFATFGLSKGSLSLGAVRIVQKDYGERAPVRFFCTECNEAVEVENMVVRCGACGEILAIDKAFTDGKGSIYCKVHASLYLPPTDTKPLRQLLNRISNI